MSVLAEWQSHFGFSQEAQIVFSYMISSGAILLIFATFLLLSGGLLLLLGIRERLGLSLLILFLIPATLLFHPFWWVEGPAHETQVAMFLKNCAILGCLLQMLLLHAQTRPQETMAPFRF
jgi:putative oxidoreductase